MTDNEKAATFLGWKPLTACHSGELNLSTAYGKRYYCLACGICELSQRAHFLVAPNMTDPCNYMRALETCDSWGKDDHIEKYSSNHRWEPLSPNRRCNICGVIESDIEPQRRAMHSFSPLMPAPALNSDWHVVQNGKRGTGRTAVEALVNLYNALNEE